MRIFFRLASDELQGRQLRDKRIAGKKKKRMQWMLVVIIELKWDIFLVLNSF